MDPIRAVYRLTCAPGEAERLARSIAYEQTVELPEAVVTWPHVREGVVGKVTAVEPIAGENGTFTATVEYAPELASGQLPQLLNLVFGNVSIQRNVRLVDLHLPEALLARFRGPTFGRDGIRALTGVYGRPLLATALKPRGLPTEELARLAGDFARGGGDLVKDDQNLVEASLEAFEHRVALCHAAVEEANAATGRRCLYLANACAPASELPRLLEFLVRTGVPGALISPLITGLDVARDLAGRYSRVMMAHPSFAGSFFASADSGIEPGLLLGTLFRLAGADLTIFPSPGGRFPFTREDCSGIARRLAEPLGGCRAALPAPAGGIQLDTIPELAELYGADAVLLIGGALRARGDDLSRATAELREEVCRILPEKLAPPEAPLASVCEVRAPGADPVVEHLEFRPDFTWRGRTPAVYKDTTDLPFRDVTRSELLAGRAGSSQFDLRYFEIGPGGYSSREKHLHIHAIIAARGRGVLVVEDRRWELSPFDVAHVPPLQVHQLRNESPDQPFGFFCIVDRERDRPMAP